MNIAKRPTTLPCRSCDEKMPVPATGPWPQTCSTACDQILTDFRAEIANRPARGRDLIHHHGSVRAALKAIHPDQGGDPSEWTDLLAALTHRTIRRQRQAQAVNANDQARADLLGLTTAQVRLLRTVQRDPVVRPGPQVMASMEALTQRGLVHLRHWGRYVLTDHGRRQLARPLPDTPIWLDERDGLTTRPNRAARDPAEEGTAPIEWEDTDHLDPGWHRRGQHRHEDAHPTRRRRAA